MKIALLCTRAIQAMANSSGNPEGQDGQNGTALTIKAPALLWHPERTLYFSMARREPSGMWSLLHLAMDGSYILSGVVRDCLTSRLDS